MEEKKSKDVEENQTTQKRKKLITCLFIIIVGPLIMAALGMFSLYLFLIITGYLYTGGFRNERAKPD